MPQISIRLPAMPLTVTPEQFAAVAAENQDLRLERKATGELVVSPPTGWESSARNTQITRYLANWADGFGGLTLESSGGCRLPNGSLYAPDAAWVSEATLARARQMLPVPGEYFPLCPDFVVELRSKSDRLLPLQNKMQEYMENGALLGWLIDPQTGRVDVYRLDHEVEVLGEPEELSGEDVLPGFVLQRRRIW
ncbi:uncharacterized protein conserved in cyanobacteria [Rubidibacter lacunae KORDI 51-2]|uniref:Uncharacterized protein conserved in cyanobacteria n=1 Tax=Rubidibacter lacunae KORDI 51-2 TaxID=582515 RepID=U5DJN9_9CHRO|nr:Uma2 family endonuclease [Rubidibacter lacunae]ERN39905.1 uncharacterized protein conserved in cyanobacteria [Rubidibacter lacunae KORDI 51-2]